MDIVTYILAVNQAKKYVNDSIQSLGAGFTYKGSVDLVSSLPANASLGDLYTVDEDGGSYVWDGEKWFTLALTLTETLLRAV